MRVAVLGTVAAAALGATLAIVPLSTVGTPVRGSGACTGASCERLASVLVPQAGTPAGPAALAAPAPAPPAPAQAAGPSYALPTTQPAAAQVIAPGLSPQPAVPSAAVPGLGVPGVPGQVAVPAVGVPGVPAEAAVPGAAAPGVPGLGLPGTDIPASPDLINQAYGLVNGVVAANTVNPIVSGVLGTAGIVVGVGESGVGLLTTLAYLDRANGNGAAGSLTGAARLVSLLAPTVGVPQLPAVSLPGLAAGLPALPSLPAAAVPAAGLPALPAGLPALPAGLPAPPQLPALPQVPLPQLPPSPQLQLPPAPKLCGPQIGPFQPCT